MENRESHLKREDLLLFVDRELDKEAASRARAHLAGCEPCRSLLKEVETTLEQLDGVYREESRSIRENPGQRSLLQSRLRHEAMGKSTRWSWLLLHQPLIYSAAALLIVALSAGWIHHSTSQHRVADSVDWVMPNPSLTPGATRAVEFSQICPAKDDDKDPEVPAGMRQAVFDEYKVPQALRARGVQVDYLINPQLGGTGDLRNLWPQLYQSVVWNAYAKDALEDRLHTMVCNRKIDLPEAQHEIATDWIGAYKKYFHTQTPLPEQAALSDSDNVSF